VASVTVGVGAANVIICHPQEIMLHLPAVSLARAHLMSDPDMTVAFYNQQKHKCKCTNALPVPLDTSRVGTYIGIVGP